MDKMKLQENTEYINTEEPEPEIIESEIIEEEDDRDPITVAKESLYDRLPFTFQQVDIFCKLAIAALILIFVYYGFLKV